MRISSTRSRLWLQRFFDHFAVGWLETISGQTLWWPHLKAVGRLILVILLMASFVVLLECGSLLVLLRLSSQRALRRLMQHFSKAMLKVVVLDLSIYDPRGRLAKAEEEAYLLLCNHLSYLDAVVLMAVSPAVFVTSIEMSKAPILGAITRAAGCVFVERRQRLGLKHDVSKLTQTLLQGLSVVMFPEATTSDGKSLLPFKSSLLAAALNSRAKVLPLRLCYQQTSIVAWYGSMTFWPHLWQLLRAPRLKATLTVLEPISFRQSRCRKKLTREVRQAIAAASSAGPA